MAERSSWLGTVRPRNMSSKIMLLGRSFYLEPDLPLRATKTSRKPAMMTKKIFRMTLLLPRPLLLRIMAPRAMMRPMKTVSSIKASIFCIMPQRRLFSRVFRIKWPALPRVVYALAPIQSVGTLGCGGCLFF